MKLVSSGPKITVFSYPSTISPHTGVNVVCGFRHSRFSFLCSGVLAFPSSSSQENQVPAFASFSLSVGSSWLYVDEPSRKMHPLAEIVFWSLIHTSLSTYLDTYFRFNLQAGLTPCLAERINSQGYTGSTLPGRYSPDCDRDGNYKPLQCRTASGVCWCVDSQGQEIPGTRGRGRKQCPAPG